MIVHYIVEQNIFVVIVYMVSLQKKLIKNIKNCFNISGKQTIKKAEKGEYVQFKYFEKKMCRW